MVIFLVRKKYQERGERVVIRTDELKGIIAKCGFSQAKVAQDLGITEKTFYAKMKKGIFDSDEISQMIHLLNIDNPVQIFFASDGT